MTNLRTRLALTYSLVIISAVVVLSFVSNILANQLFAGYVKDSIQRKNTEIVSAMANQYDSSRNRFNTGTVQTLGMSFLHDGFILVLKDNNNRTVWDARACDLDLCADVIKDIQSRTNHKMDHVELMKEEFPLIQNGKKVGTIVVESFGPLFYTENESNFLAAFNKFVIVIGAIFAILSAIVSIIISSRISKPILNAASTAEKIEHGDFSARVDEQSKTVELNQLAKSINGLALALENGEQWQKRVTSDISHELRTPLTTLQGNFEAMIDGVVKPTPERIQSCYEEVVRLNKLVEDLKQLSILERENIHIHKTQVDLFSILKSVVNQHFVDADSKGIQLHLEGKPSPYIGDANRLTQVFVNLLSNAIKYTDHGEIIVSLKLNRKNEYEISFKDTGIGVSEEEIPHLFERFYRADKSRNRKTGGAGIGLTISKSIIDAHEGVIQVESELGKGSCFTIILSTNI
ncbi:MAG: periplasmic sensor signal transduction histidine kinase [Bacillales bacterium]|jgi:signal transduction histidine kinase|nr:periplasmic sensor signal transduction histidine kinase [Bacillales bacterium]